MTTMPREQSPATVSTLMLDELEARAEASGDDAFQAGVSVMRTIDEIANFPSSPGLAVP